MVVFICQARHDKCPIPTTTHIDEAIKGINAKQRCIKLEPDCQAYDTRYNMRYMKIIPHKTLNMNKNPL